MGNLTSHSSSSALPPLVVAPSCDTVKYMGTWFVIAVKPTIFEKTCSNAIEKYTRLDNGDKGPDVDIDFKYNQKETPASPLKALPQKGWVQGNDKTNNAEWKISPLWPLKLPYKILEVEEDDYTVIGYPNREYCWIMARKPRMPDATYERLVNLLRDKHQYDLTGLRKVPQLWTREERDKRGLTDREIPDSMLD